MGSFWEQFILYTVLGILAGFKKSPQNIPVVKTILVHILDDLCQVLGVTPPVVP